MQLCIILMTNAQLVPRPTPPAYILSMTSYGIEYPFGQFGSGVLDVSHPSFQCSPAFSLVEPA